MSTSDGQHYYRDLDASFTDGTAKIDPNAIAQRGGTELSEDELVLMLTGRPRAEEPRQAIKTWHIRTPEALHYRTHKQAEAEGIPDSALIRKALVRYLEAVGA